MYFHRLVWVHVFLTLLWTMTTGDSHHGLKGVRVNSVAPGQPRLFAERTLWLRRLSEATPQVTQSLGQAIDVRMADVQCDQQLPNERVAYRAALQVVPTTHPHHAGRAGVVTGQPMQIDLAAPRAGQRKEVIPPLTILNVRLIYFRKKNMTYFFTFFFFCNFPFKNEMQHARETLWICKAAG